MSSECSILGTPSICINDSVLGYNLEQEKVYGSVINFSTSVKDQKESILEGVRILKNDKSNLLWKEKSKNIINDKIDVTNFMVNLFLNFN